MKINVYAIKDNRMGFLSPTFEDNDEVAYRNFAHAVQTSGSILTSHKQDFALYKIGYYETDRGLLTPVNPELIIDGGDILVEK